MDQLRIGILMPLAELGSRLILTGQRPAEEVPLWLTSADLIVHPGIGMELFGMVGEAMSMGRTIIASDLGGIPEMHHGEDVFLVSPGDTVKLGGTILELLGDPAWRDEMGPRAWARDRSLPISRFIANPILETASGAVVSP